MLICMHCLLLASSRQWSGGYNYSHTYNYTYSYSGDKLCLFTTLAQSAAFICVYMYMWKPSRLAKLRWGNWVRFENGAILKKQNCTMTLYIKLIEIGAIVSLFLTLKPDFGAIAWVSLCMCDSWQGWSLVEGVNGILYRCLENPRKLCWLPSSDLKKFECCVFQERVSAAGIIAWHLM